MTDCAFQILISALQRTFAFEDERYVKALNALIHENDTLAGRMTHGFNFKGQDYGRDGTIVNPHRTTTLAPSLIPKMVELSQTKQNVEFDRKLVEQNLRKLLVALVSLQDMRDALPECVVTGEPAFSGLPRTREPGWNLVGDPRSHRQYFKVITKIEMYFALRFLY